ncbi:ADK1 [Symbiodinium sp. KB8]|nr:ADK1 [Symbiodinium sp. KB8]
MAAALSLAAVTTQDLVAELKRRNECLKKPQTHAILVGPPGCGKGTQAPRVVDEYCVCHLATGDMLRAAVSAGTDLGKKAKAVMEAGGLVDDDLVVGIIADNINRTDCYRGFVLDGFPRTVGQAEKLDALLAKQGKAINHVVKMSVDDEVVVERISGRWIHKPSGRSYHTKFNPPKVAGVDDVTGEALIRRKDDNPDTIRTRLAAFHKQTAPVLEHYKSVVASVDAQQKIDTVTADIFAALR